MRRSHDKHDQIALFHRDLLRDRCRRVGKLVGDALEIFEHLRAALSVEHGLNVVALLARKFADFGRTNRNHRKIRIDRQFLQILRRKAVAHVYKCRQPQVRLVDPILPDGLVVIHSGKRRLDLIARSTKGCGQKPFHHFPHAFRLRIRHFQIDLREFRLAIGAQIFIAEAAHDLKIFVEAGDHQDLFE